MQQRPNNLKKGTPNGVASWNLAAILIICLIFLALTLTGTISDFSAAAQTRSRRPARSTTATSIDYSKFSHNTEKHRAACVTCHKTPTKNWRQAGDYPDVADYPDHEACVSCHRRQFFRGANPQICTVCHLKSSPRDERRYAFRNPASLLQFEVEFPHDKHQDVIARMKRRFDPIEPSDALFVRAVLSFFGSSAGWASDAPGKVYNNCTICHGERKNAPAAPAGGWVDSIAPDPATFKAVPVSHASCFNCHWKSQPPVSSDCAGCHKDAAPHLALSGAKRISMKFRHAREQHVAECTTCHINITKAATLRGLTPDVPITSCTECHNKDGLRLDVAGELESVDRNKSFVCVYCHTSDVGRMDPPASHYLIAGRAPIKRKDVK